MVGFLKKIFGSSEPGPAKPAAELEYNGFRLIATPAQVSGGWSTQGTIEKTVGGELKSIDFVRADTSASQDAAAQMSLDKAKKIVDERGDAVFDADRA
ncbi:MAG: HlyU family transcriptional regulator [Gammaproteobacteria bacterium]